MAVGNAQANPNRLSGKHVVFAENHGVKPGNGNTAPLQAAVNEAIARAAAAVVVDGAKRPTVTVFVPGADNAYYLDTPVYINGNYVEIKGEKGSTRIAMGGTNSFPAFVVGLSPTGGIVPDSTFRPDLWNGGSAKLDTSAITGAGQKYGLRFRSDMWATAPGSSFSHGGMSTRYSSSLADNWQETRQLTIDAAVEGPGGAAMPTNAWIAMVGSPGSPPQKNPTPFCLFTSATNTYSFYLGTQTAQFANPDITVFSFTTGAATGVQKITVQVDLTTSPPTIYAAVNGLRVAVSGGPTPSNSNLSENKYESFVINSPGSMPGGSTATADWNLYGLSMTRAASYTTPSVGSAQARADSGSLNDHYRFFDPTRTGLVGYLGFTEAPPTRLLAISPGPAAVPARSSAMFLYNSTTIGNSLTSHVRFSDLEVTGNAGYGAAVYIGSTLETHFDNFVARGSLWGVANIPLGSNYMTYFNHCNISSGDAGIMGVFNLIEANDITFDSAGRMCFRLLGCSIDAKHIRITGAGNPGYCIVGMYGDGYGGTGTYEDMLLDTEGDGLIQAGFYVERHANAPTTLVARNCNFGTMGPMPYFKLVGNGLGWPSPPGILLAELCQGDFIGPTVEMDDPTWVGKVTFTTGDNNYHVNNIGTSNGRVQVEDTSFVSPPHFGKWYRNSSKFIVTGAADAQFSEIGIDRDGIIGSATPPTFLGKGSTAHVPNASLAAYATDHTAISATITGHPASSYGCLTNAGQTVMSLKLAGQLVAGAPASLKFGLSNQIAWPRGTLDEPSGAAGYSAATFTNDSSLWTAASAGAKSNARSISFGTATAKFTYQALYVYDVTSGIVVATVQFPQTVTVNVGDTPTIPIGGLTLTHTPLPGTQFGCLTDYAWGKLWDFEFGGVTFTPPTTFYVALSTATGSKTTTSLSEPSGNGYARVAVTNNPAHWRLIDTQTPAILQQCGDMVNAQAITFGSPTGTQGALIEMAITDDPTAGHVWAVAPLTIPVSPVNGGTAPGFAANALIVTVD